MFLREAGSCLHNRMQPSLPDEGAHGSSPQPLPMDPLDVSDPSGVLGMGSPSRVPSESIPVPGFLVFSAVSHPGSCSGLRGA